MNRNRHLRGASAIKVRSARLIGTCKVPGFDNGVQNQLLPCFLRPRRELKTPSGIAVFSAACRMALVTSSFVPGCDSWAFTITGQPAASAEAVSPPAVENARGKLLAPKTTTGPDRKSDV